MNIFPGIRTYPIPIFIYNILSLSGGGCPFHPSVPSSIHPSSSSRKKKMMEEDLSIHPSHHPSIEVPHPGRRRWWKRTFPSIRPIIHPSKFLIPEEKDDGRGPFHPSVLSSIHPSSSSRKKKMMEEEEDDYDEWQQQQFIQMFMWSNPVVYE